MAFPHVFHASSWPEAVRRTDVRQQEAHLTASGSLHL